MRLFTTFLKTEMTQNLPVPSSEAKGENRLEQWYNYITFEDNKFEVIKTCLNKLISYFNQKNFSLIHNRSGKRDHPQLTMWTNDQSLK